MNEKTNTGSRRRKVLSATLAIAMVLTMLLSGTLAYFMQTSATNTFRNTSRNVVGHDDFLQVGYDEENNLKYNKDIYVENLGGTPVFVRVKLTEDFTLDGMPVVDKNAPVAHIPVDGSTLGVGTAEGDKQGQTTKSIHDYFTWDIGNGEGADTSRTTYLSAKADLYTNGEQAEVLLEEGVAKDSSGKAYDVNTETDENIKANIRTGLAPAPVITMKEYMSDAKEDGWRSTFVGWVIDDTQGEEILDSEGHSTGETADGGGWAYWSQMLKGGETTGLLLNGVTVSNKIANDDYTYNIHVDFEVVDQVDKGIWVGEQLKDSSNQSYQESDLERVKTRGALKLLEIAEGEAPPQEAVDTVADILGKKAATDSQAARNIYDLALSWSAGYSLEADRNGKFGIALMQEYERMADSLVALKEKAKTDPAVAAKLAAPVIVLKEATAGDATSLVLDDTAATPVEGVEKITVMDNVLANYLVSTYGLGDNTLTYEEALGIINVNLPRHSAIASLKGLDLKHFENLRELILMFIPQLTEVPLEQFVIKEGDKVTAGLNVLYIDHCSRIGSKVTAPAKYVLDFTDLAQTLSTLELNDLGSSKVKIDGLSKLKNLRKLNIADPTNVKNNNTENSCISIAEINTILKQSPDIEFLYLHSIKSNADGSASATEKSVSALDLSGCTNLTFLQVSGMGGTLKLFSDTAPAWTISTIKRIECSGASETNKLECDLGRCEKLTKLQVGDYCALSNIPNGLG